ncbi:glycosyltransferase family protein [Azohydromonas lata]|uniref:Glycosyltransferase family 1 protein n=1 Tax=Azohydromonas lata TaxID=45677 RepID=A0ABU5INZ5_9BURK|nr:hypothetical protein [Azohydromonas lata]MDZ5460615.1 hypothetical protein [Azohydromonas lata]
MSNIVYFSVPSDVPSGGLKVIYRHSELINERLGSSQIYNMIQPDSGFACSWFSHKARIKTDKFLDPGNDFVVLPEGLIFGYWKRLVEMGVNYGIFVQNGYLMQKNLESSEFHDAYKHAKIILCISQDVIRCVNHLHPGLSEKICRVTYSIDRALFKPAEAKEKIITYMPRKMSDHSKLVIAFLEGRLPAGWRLQPIDGVGESEVARLLSKSMIFMAFSYFEGLPVPPVEAAHCGNLVIGYTGQGGREYWQPPRFTEIPQGDIVSFAEAVLQAARRLDADASLLDTTAGCETLFEAFSPDFEQRLLRDFVSRVDALFA